MSCSAKVVVERIAEHRLQTTVASDHRGPVIMTVLYFYGTYNVPWEVCRQRRHQVPEIHEAFAYLEALIMREVASAGVAEMNGFNTRGQAPGRLFQIGAAIAAVYLDIRAGACPPPIVQIIAKKVSVREIESDAHAVIDRA